MENHLFPNHFEPPSSSSSMPTWQSLSSPMEIQQSHDFYYNPSADHALHYDSALSSIVSSPAASDPNNNDNLVIRELIGKLGTIGNNSTNNSNSCYSTPLNSPPKLNQMMNHHLSGFGGKPMALNSGVAQFATDPGFAERAAKFSCFGSRSFNGRSSQLAANNGELAAQRSAEVIMENGKLTRVASSPSLKTLIGSQIVAHENKNYSALQGRMEVDNAQEESSISEQNPNVGNGVKPSPDINSRKRKASSTKGKAKETSITTKGVEGKDSNAKRNKANEDEGNENGAVKFEEEIKGDNTGEEKKQNKSDSMPHEPPKDYIHVRARRGQATDSHSLAERVRREKISERMKLLQDLVPGCNKVTGKALMLDEIINYVQSLQRQVEFLSMKLSSVNSKMDFSIESLISKDIFQSNNSLAHPIYPLESSASAFIGHQTQQDQVIQYNIPNGTVTHSTVDPLDTAFCQNLGMQLHSLNGFNEGGSQFPLTFCEDDLNTIVQMGSGHTANSKTPTQSLSFNGSSSQASQMKVEL